MKRRQLQEQVSDHTNQDDHHARHQHSAEEGHIFARRQHVGRAAEEDQCGAAQRQADQIAHAGRKVRVQHRPKDIAEEAGESEGGNNPGGFIRRFVGQEHQTVHPHEG